MSEPVSEGPSWVRRIALAGGPIAALLVWTLLPVGTDPGTLTWTGRLTLGVAAWMAVWWLSEAVPLEATALLPLLAFPALNIAPIKAAAAPYADPTIFFFMGGMMMGAAMERWGLPRRFALHVLARVGVRPGALIFGAMAASAVISMWVNNTSTCVMMLPIGMSIVRLIARGAERSGKTDADHFATAMILGIAWAATIGGVGTLFGTAPNIILQGAVQNLMGERLTFTEYALIGMPIVAIYLPMVWLVLMWFYPPGTSGTPETREAIRRELAALGPMTWPERCVLAVLAGAMILWTLQDPINGLVRGWTGWLTADGKGVPRLLSEAGVAILAPVVLFLLPARGEGGRRTSVLDWPTANSIQWGVLVLFGGGLSLAEAMTATGVNTYLGGFFEGLRGMPTVVIVLGVAAFVTFATEVASNTAIATTFLPVAYAAANKLGIHPYYLMLPVALSASYAFMMPMGTPPNAMAIATGRVRIGQMARPGFVLNLMAIGLITLYVTYVAPLVLVMKQ